MDVDDDESVRAGVDGVLAADAGSTRWSPPRDGRWPARWSRLPSPGPRPG
jgi:hypothetical protein